MDNFKKMPKRSKKEQKGAGLSHCPIILKMSILISLHNDYKLGLLIIHYFCPKKWSSWTFLSNNLEKMSITHSAPFMVK
jgi:hypothetical protein